MTLLWIATLLIVTIALYFIVPRERIARFMPFGVWAGLGIGSILLYVNVVLLGVWQFNQVDFFTFAGIPIALALTWIPLEIGYAHFFPTKNSFLIFLVYILALPVISTAFHFFLIMQNFVQYNNWGLMTTLLVSIMIHGALALYLYKYVYKHNLNEV